MKTSTVQPKKIVGISVRTSNANGQAAQDIPALWNTFMEKNILAKIPNKVNDEIYTIYTDYEGDHTKPYTTVIGCAVTQFDNLPEGLVSHTIEGGQYQVYVAKGDLYKGAVIKKWQEIWGSDLNRAYTSDFEIYGEKSADMHNAEVDIFVGIH